MKQSSVAVGLMLCEQVIVEERTRNITPVNCFNRRWVTEFPSERFPFIVFALLTDGSGEMDLEVVVHRLDTFEEIYQFAHPVKFTGPLQDFRCMIRLRNCSFPVPGAYQAGLFVDQEIIAQRRFEVLKREENK